MTRLIARATITFAAIFAWVVLRERHAQVLDELEDIGRNIGEIRLALERIENAVEPDDADAIGDAAARHPATNAGLN